MLRSCFLPLLSFMLQAGRSAGPKDGSTLSVTASPCHLSRKGEALAKAERLPLISWLLLPLTYKDETCPLCQGLHLRGRWHFAKRNDGRGLSVLFAKGSPLRKTSPGRGKMSPPGDKKGNSCRRRRLRGFVPEAPSPGRRRKGFVRPLCQGPKTTAYNSAFLLSTERTSKKLAGESSPAV